MMCRNRTGDGVEHGIVPWPRRRFRGGTPVWLSAVIAVLLLVTAGIAYRAVAARVQGDAVPQVRLPIPLEDFPRRVDHWVGEDQEIPEVTQIYIRRNFADDYISRRYTNVARGIAADIYVVYCASKPGGILGHKPSVCFPANGWIDNGATSTQIVTRAGRSIPCLVHQFRKPAPAYQQVVVLSFYVLNGQITLTERDFSGIMGRRPNLLGDPARYVAQVQVSSILEHSARTAIAEMADLILAFLPDPDGYVRAIDVVMQTEDAAKSR